MSMQWVKSACQNDDTGTHQQRHYDAVRMKDWGALTIDVRHPGLVGSTAQHLENVMRIDRLLSASFDVVDFMSDGVDERV